MNILKACRVCLSTEDRLLSILHDHRHIYRDLIELLLGCKLLEGPGMSWLCYRCAHIVRKLFSFRELCTQADKVFVKYLTNKRERKKNFIDFIRNERKHFVKSSLSYTETVHMEIMSFKLDDEQEVKEFETKTYSISNKNLNDRSNEETNWSYSLHGKIKEENCSLDLEIVEQTKGRDFDAGKQVPTEFLEISLEKEDLKDEIKIEEASIVDDNDVYFEEEDSLFEDEETSCDICGRHFSSMERLAKHIKTCKKKRKKEKANLKLGRTKRNDRVTKLEKGPNIKVEKRKDKIFTCTYCDESFSTKMSLTSHMSVHLEARQCKICNKTYKTVITLNCHMAKHTGLKICICEICGNSYQDLNSFRIHMRNAHYTDKKFTCDICNKNFATKERVRLHILRHTSVERFSCEVCGKLLVSKKGLQDHIRIHTNDKRFFCSICGHRFVDRGSVNKHKMVHTGEKRFECDICGFKTRTSSSLILHRRKHTGERPYPCLLCPSRCVSKSKLNRHMKVHNKIKKVTSEQVQKQTKM